MDAASVYFGRKLKELIDAKIEMLTGTVMGAGISDFSQYKSLAGQVYALKEVLRMMDDINLNDDRRNDVGRISGQAGSRHTAG